MQENVLSRVKILGRMNIAEKRLPQDGRASARLGSRIVDLRIASIPTSLGERVVVRLLDKGKRIQTLNELGMDPGTLQRYQGLVHRDHGIILVTGPTGGGKSTTLYASLGEINAKNLNIVSLEDPIEYRLEGVSQTQINEIKGLTFASGLRSVLRQDPDVIMVGEIRDEETAKMAIQSALTGHLVFSTLHTNDAPSTVTRLLDLGIEPFLVASSVVGVLAQRLVRRICLNCRKPLSAADDSLNGLGDSTPLQFRGSGCSECRGTGYFGRVGLFELMCVDDAVRNLIQSRANASEIRAVALAGGMRSLHEDGLKKVHAGVTTLQETLRVTQQNV